MTKIYDIIFLNGQSYMVDKKSAITEGNSFIIDNIVCITRVYQGHIQYKPKYTKGGWNYPRSNEWRKILATTDTSLGLPLLPAVEEDAKVLAERDYPRDDWSNPEIRTAWIRGYKAAKAKRYTEEDIKEAYRIGTNDGARFEAVHSEGEFTQRELEDNYNSNLKRMLQRLNPLPKQVEVDCDTYPVDPNGNTIGTGMSYPYKDLLANFTIKYVPKTVNNIVVVKRWIYENPNK